MMKKVIISVLCLCSFVNGAALERTEEKTTQRVSFDGTKTIETADLTVFRHRNSIYVHERIDDDQPAYPCLGIFVGNSMAEITIGRCRWKMFSGTCIVTYPKSQKVYCHRPPYVKIDIFPSDNGYVFAGAEYRDGDSLGAPSFSLERTDARSAHIFAGLTLEVQKLYLKRGTAISDEDVCRTFINVQDIIASAPPAGDAPDCC